MIPQTGQISLTVNGEQVTATVPVRRNLVDFLRSDLGLTGSHVGCEHGVCGACTIEVDGAMIRGCLMLAVQADGAEVTTVEGLADSGRGAALRDAFEARNALQCGYCTPGMLATAHDIVTRISQRFPDTAPDAGIQQDLQAALPPSAGSTRSCPTRRRAYTRHAWISSASSHG